MKSLIQLRDCRDPRFDCPTQRPKPTCRTSEAQIIDPEACTGRAAFHGSVANADSLNPLTISHTARAISWIVRSVVVFAQAAGALRTALVAKLLGYDVEPEVRALMETW
jgi:hypothetical protein